MSYLTLHREEIIHLETHIKTPKSGILHSITRNHLTYTPTINIPSYSDGYGMDN
jgi:hypothetical protein